MDVELKHTWRVSRKAWYVRFYRWLWNADDDDITFCKLFWGYVFVLPALGLFILFKPVIMLGDVRKSYIESHPHDMSYSLERCVASRTTKFQIAHLEDSYRYYDAWWDFGDGTEPQRYDAYAGARHRFKAPGTYTVTTTIKPWSRPEKLIVQDVRIKTPRLGTKFLNFMSTVPTRISFAMQTKTARVVGKVLWCVGAAGLVGAVGALLVAGGYGLYVVLPVLGEMALSALVAHTVIILGAVAGLAAVILAAFRYKEPTVYVVGSGARSTKRGVQKGAVGFREAMKIGYVAVKSNTCPKVEIED